MSYLKLTAKLVWNLDLADSYSKLADVRWSVQIGIQMKLSPTPQQSVELQFGKVLSFFKFILMTSILA